MDAAHCATSTCRAHNSALQPYPRLHATWIPPLPPLVARRRLLDGEARPANGPHHPLRQQISQWHEGGAWNALTALPGDDHASARGPSNSSATDERASVPASTAQSVLRRLAHARVLQQSVIAQPPLLPPSSNGPPCTGPGSKSPPPPRVCPYARPWATISTPRASSSGCTATPATTPARATPAAGATRSWCVRQGQGDGGVGVEVHVRALLVSLGTLGGVGGGAWLCGNRDTACGMARQAEMLICVNADFRFGMVSCSAAALG